MWVKLEEYRRLEERTGKCPGHLNPTKICLRKALVVEEHLSDANEHVLIMGRFRSPL